jgi:hypothetical protein
MLGEEFRNSYMLASPPSISGWHCVRNKVAFKKTILLKITKLRKIEKVPGALEVLQNHDYFGITDS